MPTTGKKKTASRMRHKLMDTVKAICIKGRVIRGEGYGRTLGFPTANLDRRDYTKKKISVRLGVWAGQAYFGPKAFKAGIVIGPVDKTGLPKIEAHLIGYKGSLYGKRLVICLEKYLRPFRKFKSEGGLKKQIGLDIKAVKSTNSQP